MDIENKIIKLKADLDKLRSLWKDASPAMRAKIETEAHNIKNQISVFESILKRREIKKNNPTTQLFD